MSPERLADLKSIYNDSLTKLFTFFENDIQKLDGFKIYVTTYLPSIEINNGIDHMNAVIDLVPVIENFFVTGAMLKKQKMNEQYVAMQKATFEKMYEVGQTSFVLNGPISDEMFDNILDKVTNYNKNSKPFLDILHDTRRAGDQMSQAKRDAWYRTARNRFEKQLYATKAATELLVTARMLSDARHTVLEEHQLRMIEATKKKDAKRQLQNQMDVLQRQMKAIDTGVQQPQQQLLQQPQQQLLQQPQQQLLQQPQQQLLQQPQQQLLQQPQQQHTPHQSMQLEFKQ
jgi:hypothetical protein